MLNDDVSGDEIAKRFLTVLGGAWVCHGRRQIPRESGANPKGHEIFSLFYIECVKLDIFFDCVKIATLFLA